MCAAKVLLTAVLQRCVAFLTVEADEFVSILTPLFWFLCVRFFLPKILQ